MFETKLNLNILPQTKPLDRIRLVLKETKVFLVEVRLVGLVTFLVQLGMKKIEVRRGFHPLEMLQIEVPSRSSLRTILYFLNEIREDQQLWFPSEVRDF